MTQKVKVVFPDGEREIEPYGWDVSDRSVPPKPVFHESGWRFEEMVCGKFVATRDGQ